MQESKIRVRVQAKIMKILDKCSYDGSTKTFNCPVTISYNYNGTDYITDIPYSGQTSPIEGMIIDIDIDKDSYEYISIEGRFGKYEFWIGLSIVLLFLGVILTALFNAYTTTRWDEVAGIGYMARAL